jgi:inosine-uridine nucleoside N-ribohydrolase
MTNRINAITVVLDTDMREDDAEALLAAIRQLRGVLSASGNIADPHTHVAQERMRHELGQKLLAIVYPETAR